MIGLIWNCRGLKNPTNPIVPKIKNLVGVHSPDFVFLMEIKCNKQLVFNKVRSFGFVYWGGVDAIGSSGGLFLGWKKKNLLSITFSCSNFIVVDVNDLINGKWTMILVYGDPCHSNRG